MKKRSYFLVLVATAVITVIIMLTIVLTSSLLVSAAATMTEPKFGVANQSAFNVTVTTASSATCKYSSPFEKSFAEMSPFTETGVMLHKLLNFQLPSTGQTYKFFAECSNSEKGSFDLASDTSPPLVIKAYASPAAVIQTPLQTKLLVETNENTSCKYDNQNNHYDTMRFFFNTNDIDRANYANYHEALIGSLTDKTDYNYGIMCRDVSQQLSGLVNVTFKVDTSVPPTISEILPQNGIATTSQEINLSVTTNKNSVCSYGNTTEAKESGGNFSLTTVNHQVTLRLEPGQYKYYVKCLFDGPKEATADTTFIMDNTPPSAMSVNDSQELKGVEEGYTYYLDRLTVRLKAEDKESGIELYNYSIVDGSGKVALNWTATSDSTVTVRDLKLKDGEKYFVWAFAQNKAGLKSELARSNGIAVNVLLNSDYACGDKIKDGDESDTDCGGSCSAKCANGKSCTASSDCKSNYCVNEACKAGNCADNYVNQDETDVDCGGSCSTKCSIGNKCKKNSDCETAICSENRCVAEGPCSNKLLDEGETDIDCGGLCVAVKNKKCSAGQNCKVDSDCSTGLCSQTGKCANRNDRDADGILNDADNCPDTPNKDQKDSDKDKTGEVCDADNDNDGMPDEWETKYGFNPLDSRDAITDSDGDGLSNLREFQLGTSPKSKDTDKDGSEDGKEVTAGKDPKDPKSRLGSGLAVKATILLLIITAGLALFATYSVLKKGKRPSVVRGIGGRISDRLRQNQQQTMQYLPQRRSQPQSTHEQVHKSQHSIFEELEQTYSQLSGEELFEHLRRKIGRR